MTKEVVIYKVKSEKRNEFLEDYLSRLKEWLKNRPGFVTSSASISKAISNLLITAFLWLEPSKSILANIAAPIGTTTQLDDFLATIENIELYHQFTLVP